MSENQVREGSGADSAGALMRRAREQAGLQAAALAAALKVPLQRIEALEADRHDALPGPVFTRALASSVCRQLKLDPAAVLALLPSASQHNVVVPAALNRSFRVPGHSTAARPRARLSRPAALAGAVLLLAAALVYGLPDLDFARQVPVVALPAPSSKGPALVTEAVAPAHLGASVPAAVLAQAPTVAAPGGGVQAEAPVAADGAPLSFSVQRPTWVEVVDAAGVIVVRRLLNPGEQLSADGKMPLRVTVGDAGGLQARVRGQIKDLRPLAQNNVARFEVN